MLLLLFFLKKKREKVTAPCNALSMQTFTRAQIVKLMTHPYLYSTSYSGYMLSRHLSKENNIHDRELGNEITQQRVKSIIIGDLIKKGWG